MKKRNKNKLLISGRLSKFFRKIRNSIFSLDIFESSWFIFFVVFILLIAILATIELLPVYGAANKDIALVIATAILTIPITLLSITIPLNRTLKNDKKQAEEEVGKVHLSATTYIGAELVTNLDLLEMMDKGFAYEYPFGVPFNTTDEKLKIERIQLMSVIQATAEEINKSLSERNFTSLLASGVLVKMQNQDFDNHLQMAYEDMRKCKAKLRQIAQHFAMIQNPPQGKYLEQFALTAFNEQVPTEIKVAKVYIQDTIKSVKRCLKTINKVLKPYEKQFKIERLPDIIKKHD